MKALLIQRVDELFKKHLGDAYRTHSYLLALSGGSDSMALFTLLQELLPKSSLKVMYVDHGVRRDSKKEAKELQSLVTKKKIDFFSVRLNPSKKDENSLRDLRWESLYKKQKELSCNYILTAHHLEDQLETFLQRLIRGTSVFGLSSMKVLERNIFRPLLTSSKEELLAYLTQQKVSFFLDETNQDTAYFRNQIRLELLPVLYKVSKRYGDKEKFLSRFEGLREEIATWEREEKLSLQRNLKKNLRLTPYWGIFPKKEILKKKGRARVLLLKAILRKLSISLEQKHLVTLSQSVEKSHFHLELPEGLKVRESFGVIYFQNKEQQTALSLLKIDNFGFELNERIAFKKEFRFFKPGDSLNGKKMKEWFQELKIPYLKRSVLPVLAKKNTSEVLWFLGLPSALLKVTKNPLEISVS